MSITGARSGLEPVMMSTFGVVRFRELFLFLFVGREVRLPSRRRALLAWGSGDCLNLFLLPLPIASLFASGHVNLLWLMNRLSQPLQRLCPNARNAPEQ